MLQNLFYIIYIILWKGFLKKIIFLLTRTHEIERILKSDDTSFSKYIQLSN